MSSYLDSSIVKRAQEKGRIEVRMTNPRDFTKDVHRTVDDRPYGGGPGMVLMAEPILDAVDAARGRKRAQKIILFSPSGTPFTNALAREWAASPSDIILIAGHYEGVDARVKDALGAEEISIGNYVLTGGELPALVVIDAVTRQLPGVLGKLESLEEERVASPDVYTRPETIIYKRKKYSVPEILRTGHHKKIEAWRAARKRNC